MTKGFTWTNWIKPQNQKPTEYHVIGWNFGDKFDGFHTWDINKKGKKVKCKHGNRKAKENS